MRVETENGHIFDLSDSAVQALKTSRNAREADNAFEGFAPHVPPSDRVQVWFAI